MKQILVIVALAAVVLFLLPAAPAEAGHRHYRGCSHWGSGYGQYGGYGYGGYYGGYGYGYRAPVYVAPAPVYANYWHNHFYGGRYMRCHYYSGYHHYRRPYYRPRTSFHIGISIFR